MKPSRFNIYRTDGAAARIFNTFSGRSDACDAQHASAIEAGAFRSIPVTLLRRSLMAGVLVPDDVDEEQRFAEVYRGLSQSRAVLGVVCVLTYACNLRCPYCFEEGVQRRVRLGPDRAARVIAAIQDCCERDGTQHLSLMLFGGEPLLEAATGTRLLSSLSDWCGRTKRQFTGSMSTNGTLITRARMAPLAPFLRVVQVTLDGPREIHDKTRIGPRAPATYDRILDGIDVLLSLQIRVHLRIQVSAQNAHRIGELLSDISARGLLQQPNVRISLNTVQDFSCRSCGYADGYVAPGSELEAAVLGTMPALLPKLPPARQILPCLMSGNHLCIDADGALYKCIVEVGQSDRSVGVVDAAGRFAFNARYHEFMSRDPLHFEPCRACAYLPLCGGGCPAAARTATGSWLNPICTGRDVLRQRVASVIGGV